MRSFSIYEKALREAVSAEVDDFAAGALMSKDVTAGAGARMIRVSDETLDTFIALRRKALNREYGSRRLEDMASFEQALSRALLAMEKALHAVGEEQTMEHLIAAHTGAPDAALAEARRPLLGLCQRRWRRRPAPFPRLCAPRGLLRILEPSGACADAVACLKAAWLLLAPPVLNCAAAGRAALSALPNAPAEALRACAAEAGE